MTFWNQSPVLVNGVPTCPRCGSVSLHRPNDLFGERRWLRCNGCNAKLRPRASEVLADQREKDKAAAKRSKQWAAERRMECLQAERVERERLRAERMERLRADDSELDLGDLFKAMSDPDMPADERELIGAKAEAAADQAKADRQRQRAEAKAGGVGLGEARVYAARERLKLNC